MIEIAINELDMVELDLPETIEPIVLDGSAGDLDLQAPGDFGLLDLEQEETQTIDLDLLGFPYHGLSAYELAVQQGFVGTLAEWLASLKGDTGGMDPATDQARIEANASALSAKGYAEASASSEYSAKAWSDQAGIHAAAALEHVAAANAARDSTGQNAAAVSQMVLTADAHVTSAGEFANAAQIAKVAAETSRADALIYKDAAAHSATTAASSAATANDNATMAVNARNQADAFAAAALISENTASSYADDSRTEAEAARFSQITATASRDEAQIAAEASVISSQNAQASATDAAASAQASSSDRVLAQTAAGEAAASRDAAALSEQTADSHRAAASLSEQAAAQSELDANNAASAAAGSASTAQTQATNASNSAAAANTSAVNAASSFTDADNARIAAVNASSAAADSSASASTSATAAGNSATAANTSAANAASSYTNADAARIEAVNSATAAATSANNANTSATNAGNSASAASSSAVSASSSYGAAATAAGLTFPPQVVGDLFTLSRTGAPSTKPDIPTANMNTTGYIVPVGVAGGVWHKQVIPYVQGRVYEISIDVEGLIGSSYANIYASTLNESYQILDNKFGVSPYVATPNGVITTIKARFSLGVSIAGAVLIPHYATARFWTPGAILNRLATGASDPSLQSKLRRITVTDVTVLSDSESQASAAATSASNANTSATNAANSASAASVSSVSAQSTYENTVVLNGNEGFENGLTGWLESVAAATVPNNAIWNSSFDGRRGVAVMPAGVEGHFFTAKRFPVDPARKYRIRMKHWVGAGDNPSKTYGGFRALDASGVVTYTNNQYVVSSAGLFTAGWHETVSNIITGTGLGNAFPEGTATISLMAYLNYRSGGSAFSSGQTGLDGIWLEDVTESQDALSSATAAATSASSASTSAGQAGTSASAANTSATNASTSAANASTFATNASTSATNAAGSAASASSSAGVAASVGGNAINRNPMFADWPTQTGETPPTGWAEWTAAGGTLSRVAGQNGSPNAVRTASVGSGNFGITPNPITSVWTSGGEWVVIEADFTLVSGDLRGTGIYFNPRAAGVSASSTTYNFASQPDSSGVTRGVGVAGQTYRFRILIDGRGTNVDGFIIYGMTRYSTFAPVGAATIDWHRLAVRTATPEEITTKTVVPDLQGRVTTTESVAIDAQGKVNAKIGVTLNANGKISGYSSTNNGVTSTFGIQADIFQLTNGSSAVSPFTVSGGVVYAQNIVLRSGATGQRNEIDQNGARVYDSAGTLRVRWGIW